MHLKLSAAERTAYKIRCQQARSRPSTYMSLIIDYSNPISLPSHMPVPKSWMHYRAPLSSVVMTTMRSSGGQAGGGTICLNPRGRCIAAVALCLASHLVAERQLMQSSLSLELNSSSSLLFFTSCILVGLAQSESLVVWAGRPITASDGIPLPD